MSRSTFWSQTLLATLAVLPLNAGPILFSNFTGSGSYPGGRGVCGPASTCGLYVADAVSFQPSITDNLASIVLPFAWAGGTDSGLLTVDIASDSGGFPGALLESFSTDVLSTSTTIVTLTSILQPLLSHGSTYWVEVLPSASNTFAGWQFDSTNYLGLDRSTTPGSWFSDPSEFTPSLEVTGAAIPEPSTGLMAGLSLVSFFVFLGVRARRSQPGCARRL